MITDRQLIFSLNQAVTTGTQTSTDVYDTGAANININTNRELQVYVAVTTAFTGGTSLQVNVIQSATSNMASPDILASSPVIAEASLVRGYVILRLSVPRTSKRYLALQFVTVGTHTTGNVWGGIVLDTDDALLPTFETGF